MTDTRNGVSEVIGAILLISVVSVAVAIIAVGLLSTPPPQEIPHPSIVAVRNNTTQKVTLIHTGGDELDQEDLLIRLDDGPALSMFSGKFIKNPPSWPWAPGETLEIDQTPGPSQIQLIYAGGGGEELIDIIKVSAVSPGSGPDIPYVVPPPSPCDGIEDLYLDCFIEQLNKDSIYLSRSKPGSQSTIYGDLNFTVNGSISYLVIDGNPVSLASGEKVRYHFDGGSPNIRLFMIGNIGWTTSVTSVSGQRFSIYITHTNGSITPYEKSELDESWIQDYTDLKSTVVFKSTGSTKSYTRLVINGTNPPNIDELCSTDITLTNIRPTIPTLWIFVFPKSTEDNQLYVGSADSINPQVC